MSEPLKIGDRVRIVGTEYMQPSDAQHARILRGEEVGTIYGLIVSRVSVRFGDRSFCVPTGNIERVSSRRTFEEIINGLAEQPCISADYHLCETWSSEEEPAVFLTDCNEEEGLEPIVIHHIGNVVLNTCLTTKQLEAITAASQEIAANYAAELGKEEQQ